MKGRVLSTVLLAGLVIVAPAVAAFAHEGEENVPAVTSIQEAIALLRGQPDQTDAIQDKITDAMESTDQEGVDLAFVELANEAFQQGQLHEAWDLLELSVGAAPHSVVENPNDGPRTPAPQTPGAEPSPVLHEEALSGSAQSIDGAPVLLVLAVALGAAGFFIVRRVH